MTHPQGLEVVYKTVDHQFRRVRFEPTSDGYIRETARWIGVGWRVTGTEPVQEVTIDAPTNGNNAAFPGP